MYLIEKLKERSLLGLLQTNKACTTVVNDYMKLGKFAYTDKKVAQIRFIKAMHHKECYYK